MFKNYSRPAQVKIKVVGLGGGGCNAVNRMVQSQVRGVEFIGMNTDSAHLATMETPTRISLGERVTRGLGAGGDSNMGRKCAEDSVSEINQALAGADMVFLAAGMGGGTGTGAIPIVADLARQNGALTVAVVTRPFAFEGLRRSQVAEEGIARLLDRVDTLITVSNDRALELQDAKNSVDSAFKAIDEILCQAVRTVAELITVPGIINIDFASVRNLMRTAGAAWMAVGQAAGEARAVKAAKEALSSHLMDAPVSEARRVLFRIRGGGNLTFRNVSDAAMVIRGAVHPDANIVFGVMLDPNMVSEVKLTLIATGFNVKDRPAGTGMPGRSAESPAGRIGRR
jgi:cell division protein FtsZ